MNKRGGKSIIHMDLDSFFVSVERLNNSKLIGRPVIIGGTGDRGVVSSCSYEARMYGVASAMPMRMARQLCPDAVHIRGDMEQYSRSSKAVTDIIKEQAPVYEKSSIDEFYLDITGMDRFFGSYKWASELRQTIQKETGLPISFGLSTSKTVAKVATNEAKPSGQLHIAYGTEKPFLAPLSVKKIPQVGTQTYRQLMSLGIAKVQTVQEMPMDLMERVMGKNGTSIWRKANAIDNSPVVPYSERKSISTEQTFSKDTIDIQRLQSILVAMAEKVAFKLRGQDDLTGCITVKIRYSNFDTHTTQKRVAYTACDHTIIDIVKELFTKLYNRRMLIRLIGVRVSHLVGGGYQINLFEDTEEMIALYQAMDKIRTQYGSHAIKRAAGIGVKMRDFNPFNGNQ